MPRFGRPQARARAYFSTYHLWAALDFADKSGAIEEAHIGHSRFDFEHRALAISSVIAAGAFLESAINELFKDCIDDHQSYVHPIPKQAQDALRDQWKTWHSHGRAKIGTLNKFKAALRCTGATPLPPDTPISRDATDVLALRNALVHFTPQWISKHDQHTFKRLGPRFPENVLMRDSANAYFPDKCLGSGCAHWAARSARAYADQFFAQLAVKPNYQRTSLP